MRRTILCTTTAMLLAGVSSTALAANTVMLDRDMDGTAETEGVIVAGIDHDRDPSTGYLYAIDVDGDGDAESWALRSDSADGQAYYRAYEGYRIPAHEGARNAMVDMDNDGIAETESRVLADYRMDGLNDRPVYYAVDVDNDGYADHWVYNNASLKTADGGDGYAMARDFLEITNAEQVAADISAAHGSNQLDAETGPNPLDATRTNPGEASDMHTGVGSDVLITLPPQSQ